MLLSPFFLLFTIGAILAIRQKWPVFFKPVSLVGVVLVFLLITGLNKCIYQKGAPHHHQVMNWVDSNVSDDAPIGTIQVGTLGYCQDRTIYLYGKVNPEALLAQRGRAYCPDLQNKPDDCLLYYLRGRPETLVHSRLVWDR